MTGGAAGRLVVVGLGGNALGPSRGAFTLAVERSRIDRAADRLACLAGAGARLLVVHGNGPQVGRLLAAEGLGDADHLDVHVAQTQGELGYLLAEAMERRIGAPTAALVTRVLVDPDDPAFGAPSKPVGRTLAAAPAGVPAARTADGRGWRRLVPSPLPVAVVEQAAIETLLADHHLVAGGGGGIALALAGADRGPRPAVIDKDWVAALLAVALAADELLFATTVAGLFDGYGAPGATVVPTLSLAAAQAALARGAYPAGSMGPKVGAASRFVAATGRRATITDIDGIDPAARAGRATTVHR